ncbi:MAG TPA: hypothetical protein VKV74_09995 [Bryobacteraceae bacterium]|nr:hypothetical protein [Bryobacteraceae bacterium]
MYEALPDSETILAQFNRLIEEILGGSFRRNSFRPWEIELLLDMESCELWQPSRRTVLRRYQKAVQRQMRKGSRLPMKLSEYLAATRAGSAPRRGGSSDKTDSSSDKDSSR